MEHDKDAWTSIIFYYYFVTYSDTPLQKGGQILLGFLEMGSSNPYQIFYDLLTSKKPVKTSSLSSLSSVDAIDS